METNSIADTLPISTKQVSHKRWANSLHEDPILVLGFGVSIWLRHVVSTWRIFLKPWVWWWFSLCLVLTFLRREVETPETLHLHYTFQSRGFHLVLPVWRSGWHYFWYQVLRPLSDGVTRRLQGLMPCPWILWFHPRYSSGSTFSFVPWLEAHALCGDGRRSQHYRAVNDRPQSYWIAGGLNFEGVQGVRDRSSGEGGFKEWSAPGQDFCQAWSWVALLFLGVISIVTTDQNQTERLHIVCRVPQGTWIALFAQWNTLGSVSGGMSSTLCDPYSQYHPRHVVWDDWCRDHTVQASCIPSFYQPERTENEGFIGRHWEVFGYLK